MGVGGNDTAGLIVLVVAVWGICVALYVQWMVFYGWVVVYVSPI